MEVNLDAQRRRHDPGPRAEPKTPVTISLGPELIARVDAWAKRRGLKRSGLVSMALTEKLEEWERMEANR